MCGGDIVSPATVLYDNLGNPIPLSLDAFQRLRTSNPQTLFESKQIYDEQPLYWSTATTGSGSVTYNNSRASTLLGVGAAAGTSTRQSKRYFSYQPGKSQLIFATFVCTGGYVANTVRRVGYFDPSNGIFFQMDGNDLAVVVRSNTSGVVANNVVPRANWIDKLDGTGTSGLTLDPAAAQILFIDFEWLGVGTVRIGFVINGQLIPVYQFLHANTVTSVYMQTPNLPVRYEASSTGGTASLEAICCSVMSEGGQEFVGTQRVAITPAISSLASGAFEQLIAIRNKAGVYLHTPVIPSSITCSCTTTGQGIWHVIMNPTVAGVAAWNAVSNSAVEYDLIRTTITPGTGTEVAGGVFASNASGTIDSIRESLALGVSLAGVGDILVLGVTNINPANEGYWGSISWLEPN